MDDTLPPDFDQLVGRLASLSDHDRARIGQAVTKHNALKLGAAMQAQETAGLYNVPARGTLPDNNLRAVGLTLSSVDDAFRVAPWSRPDQFDLAQHVSEAFAMAAKTVLRSVVVCNDRACGLRKLREAWADIQSAIGHEGRF